MKDETVIKATDDAPVILIVDDEADITTTYAMLFGYYGFRVSTACDGKTALEIIDAVNPDIILSDYMMPLMNGAELCSALKADTRWKNTPFILSSAAFHLKDVNTPYDSLMQKPVVFDDLLKEVKRLLGKN
ncbi:MAG: response regulator [Cellvibrio sp.]|uniref:response regulator n=1 Tax=Cellvibrio sp. TaxID=1965322 RepID=UPI0031A65ABF